MTDNIKSLEPVAWECSSPEGEKPALAFLTSKKPTVEHYENQGWRVLPLYAAPVADSAMAKDAERYRWLRNIKNMSAQELVEMYHGKKLDDIIDAAIAASAEKGDKA